MQPDQQHLPPGIQVTRPLTEEAMEKEFSIKMPRKYILFIHNAFATQHNYSLPDAREILGMLDLFKDALTLTDKDYVPLPKTPEAPAPPVQVSADNGIKV